MKGAGPQSETGGRGFGLSITCEQRQKTENTAVHCKCCLWNPSRTRAGPGAQEPSAVEHGALEPSAVEPGALKPSALKPGALKPSAVEPGALEPSAVEPGEEPGAVKEGEDGEIQEQPQELCLKVLL
ncbi:hypothetical protein C0J50_7280 [Silurus asotus]|uniref:Uncharacterized protein n=1 Tax=Silurus asotus TaxID=30991 RepID=A0AAD5A0G3_SILAS|nr:hypothetical protein C0J50_7280 [Silurus asotus]